MKTYLGDAVYVEYDGNGLRLTTEDGIATTNQIYLEPEVYTALLAYVKQLADLDRARAALAGKGGNDGR